VFALTGVAAGAFGAHALRDALPAASLAIWQTAVQYQFVHALALLVIGLWMRSARRPGALKVAGTCFTLGTLLFSGSLYLLALTGVGVLGMVTPIGGVLFLIGWLAVLMADRSAPHPPAD
jgi:uncharacterized membrane protein YgdD (TMEM256/DUF423 family)